MINRIITGFYFSICAFITSALVALIFGIPDKLSSIVNFSLLVGGLTYPYGYIYSKYYLNREYDLKKSLLIGILISFLSLLTVFILFGTYNSLSIPVSEALLGSASLLLVSTFAFGIIIFPLGALSGVILYILLERYHKFANKSSNLTDANDAPPS